MTWNDVKKFHPEKWLLIEAIEAHTENDKRVLENISVVDFFTSSNEALKGYVELHRKYRKREFYVVHTSRDELDIVERRWVGIRPDMSQQAN